MKGLRQMLLLSNQKHTIQGYVMIHYNKKTKQAQLVEEGTCSVEQHSGTYITEGFKLSANGHQTGGSSFFRVFSETKSDLLFVLEHVRKLDNTQFDNLMNGIAKLGSAEMTDCDWA